MPTDRDRALEAIEAVVLPDEWEPLQPHRRFERYTHRKTDGEIDGQLWLVAKGRPAIGLIDVHGNGCSIVCEIDELPVAVEHVLGWLNRSTS